MKQHRIPIFETIAAFVAVCVVAILTALPSLQETGARNIDVADGVSVLRASVFRFSMDHNIEGQMQLPNENFVAQLTRKGQSPHFCVGFFLSGRVLRLQQLEEKD